MQQTAWYPAGLVFVGVAAAVIAAGWLWERWQRRRSWRRTAESVARAIALEQTTGK